MKLKEAITQAARATGPRCSIYELEHKLDKTDRADLNDCLADVSLTSAQISRGLKAEGHNVSGGVVQRHRKGECSCAQ